MKSIFYKIKTSLNPASVITSIGLVLLGACSDSMHTSYFKESYSSNGERIYLTGQSSREAHKLERSAGITIYKCMAAVVPLAMVKIAKVELQCGRGSGKQQRK